MNKITYDNSCTLESENCTCFEKLTDQEVQLIEQHTIRTSYKKGELICKQGTFANNIIFIETGLAKIFLDKGNESLVLKLVTEENLVGLTSVFEGKNIFQYSAQACTDCEVRLIDSKVFTDIMKTNAEFASEVMYVLSTNAIQIYGRFYCLTRKQSYGRMADTLLCISDRVFRKKTFDLQLSRKELGEVTDMATESVIRILKKFKDDGLISIEGKTFSILEYDALREISDRG